VTFADDGVGKRRGKLGKEGNWGWYLVIGKGERVDGKGWKGGGDGGEDCLGKGRGFEGSLIGRVDFSELTLNWSEIDVGWVVEIL
jgi:hypothetical protein